MSDDENEEDVATIDVKNTVVNLLKQFDNEGLIKLKEMKVPKGSKSLYRCVIDVFENKKITIYKKSNIAMRSAFNEDTDTFIFKIAGINKLFEKRFYQRKGEDSKVLTAIKRAVERKENPHELYKKMVRASEKGIEFNNLEDALDKSFASLGCPELTKIFFKATSSRMEYRKSITFNKLEDMGVKKLTIDGVRYVCNYEDREWKRFYVGEKTRRLKEIKKLKQPEGSK